MGGVSLAPAPSVYPLVGQYTTEEQDATSLGATAGAGSILGGSGWATTVAAGSNGVSLTTLAAGTALSVAAIGGPLTSQYFAGGGGTKTITVATSGGTATLSYTGKTGTPGLPGTITGIAIVSGTGAWTVSTGGRVIEQPLIIPDIYAGASIMKGDGSVFGLNDWPTTTVNIENSIAGLLPQGSGFVSPIYSDSIYGGLQWSVNSGSGVAASNVGSPIAAPNAGAGGAYASSIKVTSAATIVGDNKPFRRLLLFFMLGPSFDSMTIATTGTVVSSGVIACANATQQLAVWDSGDLQALTTTGTGFNVTWSAGGGQGIILVGAVYIQSSGGSGIVNLNFSKGGTSSGDWANTTAGLIAFMGLLTNMGMTPRRLFVGDQVGNDALNGYCSAGQAAANIASFLKAITTAFPLTSVVLIGIYNIGQVGLPGVGASAWSNAWLTQLRQVAITGGYSFIDLYARFGDLSYLGDKYGLTLDNLHMGIPGSTPSGRNGQQALAEVFVEKLIYSKAYQGGQNTSGSAAEVLFGLTSGTPLQISQGLYVDVELFAVVTTAGTFAFAYGPTSAVSNALVASFAAPVGFSFTKRIPAGWWVKYTGTAVINGLGSYFAVQPL